MEKPSRFIVVKNPDYVEQRENLYLMIWSDIPHWMVADRDVLDTIRLLDGTRSISMIANQLQDPSIDDVRTLLKSMAQANLIVTDMIQTPVVVEPILENVTVNTTRSCNLRCTHCFVSDRESIQSTLEIADLRKFIDDGVANISPNLNFAVLGGEPQLSPSC